MFISGIFISAWTGGEIFSCSQPTTRYNKLNPAQLIRTNILRSIVLSSIKKAKLENTELYQELFANATI
jgi:hypothetical protein